MIIGNNNENNFNDRQIQENTNFNRKMNQIKDNNESLEYHNPFVKNINTMQHSDPTNRENMRDKSLAILQDRLENGTITLDEFNRKVSSINNKKSS